MRGLLSVLAALVGIGTVSACRIEHAEHLSGREGPLDANAAVDRFRDAARGDLDEIDARIQQLMTLADSATGSRRIRLADQVQEFQTRSGKMEERLRGLAWSDERARRRATSEINQALHALRGDVLTALATRIAADPPAHQ